MCTHAGQEFDPAMITEAADNAIAWTQSVIDDATNWVPEGSDDFLFRRSNEKTGWIQGAFLVGMKDWAEHSGNEDHWDWLLVRASVKQHLFLHAAAHLEHFCSKISLFIP